MINIEAEQNFDQYKQIVLEANFELTLKPWADFKETILIPQIADLKKFDTYPHYVINKESFFRALNTGYSLNRIKKTIENLNKSEIPQNISITFEDWEKEFRQIRLIHGIVLKIDKEKQYLIENTKVMDKWILETLGDGIYLLALEDREEWARTLTDLGISPLPKIEYLKNSTIKKIILSKNTTEDLPASINLNYHKSDEHKTNKMNRYSDTDKTTKELLELINKMRVTKAQKEDMIARVEKKLIFIPEQITRNRTPGTVREAKGLDYRGKLQQVKEALKSGNEILEISSIISTEGSVSYLIHPVDLKKKENKYILEGFAYPFRDPFKMEIGKISKVRRLRTSLFVPK
jgi:hypothetical protein